MKLSQALRGALCALLVLPAVTCARTVRVATFNVKDGVGAVGTTEYNAVRDILQRVDADVVAFQELKTADRPNWETLVNALGYFNTTFGVYTTMSGGLYVGYASRFSVIGTNDVLSPLPAYEMTRPPQRVVLDVPGAEVPLVLWTVHQKASYGDVNEFRRAVESIRCVEDIDAYVAANPTHLEYVVLGDFNDDVGQYQSVSFSSAITNESFPASYKLGSDITFPVFYSVFPRDAYEAAGTGTSMLDATREDSPDGHTYASWSSSYISRYDYIFASEALSSSPQGAPQSEVYDSAFDDGSGGLPKWGSPLPAGTSTTASDHFLLFADVHMTDAAPGALVVAPTGGFESLGFFGGPFAPTQAQYTVINTNASDVTWGLSGLPTWLDASSAGGVLAAGASNLVAVTVNGDADLLGTGSYRSDLVFTNGSMGGEVDRRADLHVTTWLDLAGADASGVTLEFLASSNHVYTLEYTADLLNVNGWSLVSNFTSVAGSEGTMQYLDDGTGTGAPPGTEAMRSYRLDIQVP